MMISSKTSTEELIRAVMNERDCSYEEAIKLLLNLAQGAVDSGSLTNKK